MQEINLLQTRIKDTTHSWEKQSIFGIVILSILLAVFLAAGGVLYLQTKNINTQNDTLIADNAKLKTQIDQRSVSLGSAKVFQAQLLNIRALLENHIYFSSFLDEIGKFTYIKSRYLSLTAVQDVGKVEMQGQVDTYNELGKLLLGLSTSDKFTDIKLLSATPASSTQTVNGASVTKNTFSFSIDLTVKPEAFIKK
jgi:Tfp pilus assembly protein PilN